MAKKLKARKQPTAARIDLIERSQKAKAMRIRAIKSAKTEAQKFEALSTCINDYLIIMHKEENEGAETFHTFKHWIDNGHKVLKGSKAAYVWGSPRQATKKIEKGEIVAEYKKNESSTNAEDLTEKYEFWPMCALFSNLQAEAIPELENGTV